MPTTQTPDGNDILSCWNVNVNVAITSVWRELIRPPKKSILTESDLKCWLFKELDSIRKEKYRDVFSINSEITHYHDNNKLGQIFKVHHFRDLSILFTENIELNSSIWMAGEVTFNKGYKHKGPAIHFELKLVREGKTSAFNPEVSVSDLNNFKLYEPEQSPFRKFVTVWGSRSNKYKATTMIDTFKQGTKDVKASVKELIQAYIFDKESLHHGVYNTATNEYNFTPNPIN